MVSFAVSFWKFCGCHFVYIFLVQVLIIKVCNFIWAFCTSTLCIWIELDVSVGALFRVKSDLKLPCLCGGVFLVKLNSISYEEFPMLEKDDVTEVNLPGLLLIMNAKKLGKFTYDDYILLS